MQSVTGTCKLLQPEHRSSWLQLIRLQAWVVHFLQNSRLSRTQRQHGELTADDLHDMKIHALKQAQQDRFSEKISLIRCGMSVPAKSKLSSLCPFIDDDGLVHCRGRLQYADFLPEHTVNPVILPCSHAVTRLLVKAFHDEGHHIAGTSECLVVLSAKYWIIAAREAVRE